MLAARDAILAAVATLPAPTDDERFRIRGAAWWAFATFGIGTDASCPNASWSGFPGGRRVTVGHRLIGGYRATVRR
jgi:extracellular elastinolytic metalloproteinase